MYILKCTQEPGSTWEDYVYLYKGTPKTCYSKRDGESYRYTRTQYKKDARKFRKLEDAERVRKDLEEHGSVFYIADFDTEERVAFV